MAVGLAIGFFVLLCVACLIMRAQEHETTDLRLALRDAARPQCPAAGIDHRFWITIPRPNTVVEVPEGFDRLCSLIVYTVQQFNGRVPWWKLAAVLYKTEMDAYRRGTPATGTIMRAMEFGPLHTEMFAAIYFTRGLHMDGEDVIYVPVDPAVEGDPQPDPIHDIDDPDPPAPTQPNTSEER